MTTRASMLFAAFPLALACGDDAAPAPDPHEALAGGDLTVFDTSRDAFAQLAPNATREHREDFFAGNGSVFNRNWTIAPSSTSGTDGLGPTFNAKSCSSCHFKDGRGAPPVKEGEPFVGLLIRLSIPGEDDHGGPLADPTYGDQLNQNAIAVAVPSGKAEESVRVLPEGTPSVAYAPRLFSYPDGTTLSLRVPSYRIDALSYGPLADDIMLSPRVAPAVFGLGLLESVPERDVLSRQDADDADGDGISGRANYVWDPKSASTQLGRMGWKANQAGLEQQNAGAFLGDIGITSPLHADQNCPAPQAACAEAVTGGAPEVDQDKIDLVTLYTRLLAVPARRDVADAEVRRGEALFRRVRCEACHTETLQTDAHALLPELAKQTFHPYTDMLLHDLGEALADGRPDYLASGSEWRTPPLWGLGLQATVNEHTFLLHDGRARNVEEAIVWHGGEGEQSREAFAALSADERAALLRFLGSL
jgi:CxxC motif-containing protein (DUF1111 family)